MFTLTMLAAGRGDALWLSFGSDDAPRHILVDAGEVCGYECIQRHVERVRKRGETVEIDLFVVTHIDADHINGAFQLVKDLKKLDVKIHEIWFNGYEQIFPECVSTLGPGTAERLSARIAAEEIAHNRCFPKNVAAKAADNNFPSAVFSGLDLTLLAPEATQLARLKTEWETKNPGKAFERERARIEFEKNETLGASRTAGDDNSAPNESSIVLLAEFGEVSVLLAGDAYAHDIETSLDRFREVSNKSKPISFFKLSHHGSVRNLTASLVTCVGAEHYLISTNGVQHDHPDQEAVEIILKNRPTQKNSFHFNYRKPREKIREAFKGQGIDFGSEPSDNGLELDLIALSGLHEPSAPPSE
ncbi:MAG: hypothetical protein V4801_21435 [Burkholderia gladioli]